MRLHALTLQAFGPFAGQECIDFDALDQGILLVNGPTGSGKSSFLDAVTFALFGDVAGARRTLKNSLRSHHAPPEREPYVELVFSVGATRWRIRRVPQWEAPKKRGSGTTPRHASVQLAQWRTDNGRGSWHHVSSRMDEAAGMIQDVLGMDLDQFAQVVLLPQGEFAEFLRARPEDRRTLLERLFDVQRFEAVENWFSQERHQRARAMESSLTLISSHLAVISDTVNRLDDPEFSLQPWSTDSVAEVPTQLRALLSRIRQRRDETRQVSQADSVRAQAAERTLERSVTLLETQDAYARARAQLDRVPIDKVTALRARLEAATNAAGILKVAHRLEASQGERDRTQASWLRELNKLEQLAGEPLPPDLEVETRFAQDVMERRSELFHVATRGLERLQDDCAAAYEARVSQQKSEELLRSAQERLKVAQSHHTTASEALESAQQVLGAHVDVLPQLSQVEDLHKRLTRAGELADTVEQTDTRRSSAALAYLDAERAVVQLRTARLAGMAGELASDLVTGSPCPVCGSCEHPHPTTRSEETPTQETIAAAEAEAQSAEQIRLKSESAFVAAQAAHQALVTDAQARLDEIVRAVQPVLEQGVESMAVMQLIDSPAPLEELRAALKNHTQRHHKLEHELLEAESNLKRTQENLDVARTAYTTAQARVSSSSEELRRALNRIKVTRLNVNDSLVDLGDPQVCLPSAPDLTDPVADFQKIPAQVTQLLDSVKTRHQVHRELLDSVRQLNQLHEHLEGAQRRVDAENTELANELALSGHHDLAEARGAALSEAETAKLREEWEHALQTRASALTIVDDPRSAAAAHVPRPNEASLRQHSALLNRVAGRSRTEAAMWSNTYDALAAMRDTVADTVRAHLPLAQAAQEMQELANTFTGNGENTHRMRLTSYVLAAHLESVTAMANERLAHMSDGRYQLQYTDERIKGNQRSGLGLVVVDAWTGRSRDTATLSGGEAFMASLALALGLGDAVRADSGGMELHTLFVDEGFGSLDQDTLEHVMEVLDSLREGGRLVGVVSHVSELRARIPTRIDVRKTSEGSTIHTDSTQMFVSAPV